MKVLQVCFDKHLDVVYFRSYLLVCSYFVDYHLLQLQIPFPFRFDACILIIVDNLSIPPI